MQRTALATPDPVSKSETLMEFLLRAPLGMVQTASDGSIEMINPLAATALLPLTGTGRLDNLFMLLAAGAPRLRQAVEEFAHDHGTVCESLRVPVVGQGKSGASRALIISVFKMDASRLLVTVNDHLVEPVQTPAGENSGLAKELRQALADSQLFVQYQPVVGLRQDIVGLGAPDRNAGVEALVRWNHRIRGAVSPLQFISVAEECGLIGELGEFVLRTACRQFVQWKKELGARAPRVLAVNVARGQLSHPEFIASVRDILQSTGMEHEQLQLEVNEGLAAQNETVQARLQELKALGVTLALDNFGTGHSSLASLHLLPVDVIKIHRSFVNKAVDSAHYRALIDATVRVAKSLRMSAAAEGIETEAQLALVRLLGCEQGQGFYFSEAVSAANFVQWMGLG